MNATPASTTTDIVIAGGGPVGLALACALASSGLEIVVIDAGESGPSLKSLAATAGEPVFDPRVSALTVSTQQLLAQLGAWDAITAVRASPYLDMAVWDGEGTGAIHFSAADIHADNLGYIVENRLVTAALADRAATSKAITLMQGESVASAQNTGNASAPVSVGLAGGSSVQASLLVGADGARSLVREQGGFVLRQWDYGHQAIVTTVKTARGHQDTAWQRFMHSGPLAFLPLYLPGDKTRQYCSIVWSCVTDKAQELVAMDDIAFRQALGAAFEFRLGEILAVDERTSFPLWQRHVTDYVHDHVALVGDAAHTIHPLAGQGVNLGFADVQVLADVILQALARGEDYASHQVLSRYQRRRKGANLAMMAAMEGFKRLFGTQDLALTWLRNAGLNLADGLPMVKQRLMRQAMGL